MKEVIKIIIGAVARHWLSAFFGILVTRHYFSQELADSAAGSLSNEWVYDFIMALIAASLPALAAIFSRLRAMLREKLGLMMAKGTSSNEVTKRINETPLSTRVAATLTVDPDKILDSK